MTSARIAHRRLLGLAAALAASLGACAPVGDFGRREPSFIHDEVLPPIGAATARARGEPVSSLPLTEDEALLHRLGSSIALPAGPGSVVGDFVAETRFVRLTAPQRAIPPLEHYFDTLARAPFASTEARFSALVSDIRADEQRLTPFFSAAKRVYLTDEERLAALGASPLSPRQRNEVGARVAENRGLIRWVRQVLLARIAAYAYAVDRLAVETPSGQVWSVRAALRNLDARVADPLGEIALSPASRRRSR